MSFLGGLFGGIASALVGGLFQKSASNSAASAASNLNRENLDFNHNEAEINRQWNAQREDLAYMRELDAANSAHQREVADLRAAGLNPILSAGGNGANGISAPIVSSSPANAQGASNLAPSADYSVMANVLNSALDYDIRSKQLKIDQQRADNDSIRVGNESKQLKATLESMHFTNENTKANTERLKAETFKIIQDAQNGKALTEAQIKQCEAIAYQAVQVGNAQERLSIAQSNLADNQSKESSIRYETAKREYEDALHELDKELHSKPGYQKLYLLGNYIKALNPFQGFKIGNGMLRGDK